MWDFTQVALSLRAFVNFMSEIGIAIANLEITASVGGNVCENTVTVLTSFSFVSQGQNTTPFGGEPLLFWSW